MTITIDTTLTPTVALLPREKIRPGPWQPRRMFDEESLRELADSIREHGILTPLRVAQGESGDYYLVAGERRWRAAALAGLDRVPCLLEPSADERTLQLQAVVDNLHRADLRPGEEAQGLQLLAELGLSQREIAEQLGKSQAWVSQRLSLLKLPDAAVQALDHGVITVEDARELQKVAKWPELVEAVLDREHGAKVINQWRGDPHGWVGPTVRERVKTILDTYSRHEERRQKIEKLRAEGKTVYDRRPPDGLVRLEDYAEQGKAHTAAKLTCEAFVVTQYGAIERYCTDSAALKQALTVLRQTGEHLSPEERRCREEIRQRQEEEKARARAFDAVMHDVLLQVASAPPSGLVLSLLAVVAEDDADWYCSHSYGYGSDVVVVNAARWLGLKGNAYELRATFKRLLTEGSDASRVHKWLALVLADALAARVRVQNLRPHAAAWLERYGYRDPFPCAVSQPSAADEADSDSPRCYHCGCTPDEWCERHAEELATSEVVLSPADIPDWAASDLCGLCAEEAAGAAPQRRTTPIAAEPLTEARHG